MGGPRDDDEEEKIGLLGDHRREQRRGKISLPIIKSFLEVEDPLRTLGKNISYQLGDHIPNQEPSHA
jgi:hypothetical protein